MPTPDIGGMGAVWIARHLQLDAPVAVKLMDPSYAASRARKSSRYTTTAPGSTRGSRHTR